MWAFDEHRIGLKPILGKVWAPVGEPPVGERPVAVVQPRYEWSYLHGFVEPGSGRNFWWLTSWIEGEALSLVLQEFASWSGAGAQKLILLVVDQAGWHKSGEATVPAGIRLVFLPPRSPELQPAERLWPLSNEAICNRRFETLEELELEQSTRCCQLMQQTDLVQRHTGFHWWPYTN